MITPSPAPPRAQSAAVRAALVILLFFLFLLGVKGLGDGFRLLGRDVLTAFFSATANPFLGLMVGLLATTLVQSSSVTTSMVVGLVAAPENPLPLANAVPIIMGANIGTTVTNTVVALAHMGRRDEFRRAFAVATCHDFFNYLTVAALLPLELMTGYLQRLAVAVASTLGDVGGVTYESPLKGALDAGMAPVLAASDALFDPGKGRAVFLIAVSAAFIYMALVMLVRVMRAAMRSRLEGFVTRLLGANAILSILLGAIVTIMVQSSSITTALLVPLAGAGLLSLPQAFPITVGANIGTTVTALLASLAVSGPNALAGVEIALVHLFFNMTGTILIYPVPAIRRIPLRMAGSLAEAAVRSRRIALLYVIMLFYGLPAALVFVHGLFR
jgi:solute carrier family 34 (sodium-dependent phosphate cotransporter)